MFRPLSALPLCLLAASACLAGQASAGKLPPAAGHAVDFAKEVEPLLRRACVSCHGPDKQRGGLRLDDGAAALRGGNSGPAYKPGRAADSRLLRMVAGLDPDLRMPPNKKKQLSPEEVGVLRAWIDQGADWPGSAAAAAAIRPAASGHWAFQPVRRPPPPATADRAWARNPIDPFILARLEKEKIAPSPPAGKVTLLRRLHLDLTGLPPSPAEVDDFLADDRPDAYERVVDRLLASAHYGERWGRHWLDLARYADSDGFEKDGPRPFAWRYRHWVIGWLNRDLPYDRFVVEQLAGDLLPGGGAEQRVATGFHRNTLTNREGGIDKEQFRVEAVVDRANTTARVFLGLTLGCAQCHDHKYDPLPQRDYYRFFAFFNSDVERDIPAPVIGEHYADDALPAARKKALKALLAREELYLAQLPARAAAWEAALPHAHRRALPAAVRAALAEPAASRSEAQTQQVLSYLRGRDPAYRQLTRSITAMRHSSGAVVQAQTIALGRPRRTHVLLRGDFQRPGVEVLPGVPGVLPPLPGKSPNRLALARWLVGPDNPLTARVAVNWVWHKYFGRGIVPTLDDFGTQGEKPSHPGLLDHLAGEFRAGGWGLKDLHRRIVTSAAYRQSSRVRPELAARDPHNALLARQARLRLEAEVVRDTALAASGLLARRVGGPSVRPPQPAGISELSYGSQLRWVESRGADRHRRGLYTWFQRTSPYPMLLTFDAPDSNLCCVRRERSNTPLQALTLLNDAVFVECAQALARRVLATGLADTDDRLVLAFRLCTARKPTPTERARLRRLLDEVRALCVEDEAGAWKLVGDRPPVGVGAAEAAAWVVLARTLLNLDEVVTRE
jgi:hypothetical protein